MHFSDAQKTKAASVKIQNTLPNYRNKYVLFNCKITNNNKCNLCTTESESIVFYCNKSKQLWMKLEYLISFCCHFNVHISLCEIMFGYTREKNDILNLMIFLTKKYIFYKWKKKLKPF